MLKQKRIKRKITQLELALKLGIDNSYISRIEKHPETCNPTLHLILNISKYLKINPYKVFDYFVRSRRKHNIK